LSTSKSAGGRPGSYNQTFAYNDRNELTGATRADGLPYGWTRGYEYDPIGNRQSQGMDAVQTTYTSNDLNQYSYALRSDGGALFPMYDADGNMTLLDVAGDMNCDGVVNGNDIAPFSLAVTNAELYQQQYPDCEILHADLNGDGAVNPFDIDYLTDIIFAGGSGTRFEWDAENRLVRVAPAAPYDYQPAVEYAYDYRGRLIARIAFYWDPEQTPPAWVESDRRKFVWSGWLLLAELDANDQPVREYTWGLDLAGQNGQLNSLEGAGGIGGLLAVHDLKDTPDPGNDVNYAYAYDGNGNVVQVLDWAASSASTVRKARYEYDPYGNAITILDIGAYNRQPFRFSTKIWDADVGMVYYGYRWYWPTVGRWTSEDSAGEDGGLNLYAYAKNDAIGAVDALGLWKVERAHLAQASATAEEGDTIATLARTIGLEPADWRQWLASDRLLTPNRSASTPVCAGEQVRIPNTVLAYWGGELGAFGQWWVMWQQDQNTLRRRGFAVLGMAGHLASELESRISREESARLLHGIIAWGHGEPGAYYTQAEGMRSEDKLDYRSPYGNWHPRYRMGLGVIWACYSITARPHFSANGIFWGSSGVLVPHGAHLFGPSIDRLVPPGAQGTRR
jgi:RHS repeat-associated protein